jgi:DNA-binding CsgD family transcriptional regulator
MTARPSPLVLGSPAGLVVDTFEVEGQTFAILDWPTRRGLWTSAATSIGAGDTETFDVSSAQREVMGLILAGLSNAEIARIRRRSVHTVAHQVDAIFRRLGVGSRLELFALVARRSRIRESP